ncbi:uncharacterized protein KQ657_004372 [Scheffersomyces spartinae]|uniref:Protein IBD2 n=1 Tax=Scheffersomyces spartinae TaxID=45513 RepID=A0A9P7VBJ1_9ASCO|nr:uncharacterized protein KQ657_004372 [Scheffersomyces spartinae]KAG7194695.1 hypothetical protein KQ657_004372 [Scheffersomyces spartinae]
MSNKESTADQEEAVYQQMKLGPSTDPRLNGLIDPTTGKPLYPRKLFELMARNYDSWLQMLNTKKFSDDEGYLPFPQEDNGGKPIFSYSLLEALEKANTDFAERLNTTESVKEGSGNGPSSKSPSNSDEKIVHVDYASDHLLYGKPPQANDNNRIPPESLLKDAEISYLRNRISDMIKQDIINGNGGREGFNLFDTKDEEGLHEGNCGYCDRDEEIGDQDDYDLEEIDEDDDFLYDYQPTTHHIEVELNTSPNCYVHGTEGCNCPMYDDELENSEDGPSCEFTFEYDYNGKLVPTYSNVEEKLRLMNLQSELKAAAAAASAVGSSRLPAMIEPIEEENQKKSKNKKKKKKKTQQQLQIQQQEIINNKSNSSMIPQPIDDTQNGSSGATVIKLGPYCCLFCEYEAFYGTKPRQLIKSYELKLKKEMQRRQEIRRKLENAKLKALKKQQEMRQKQVQQLDHEALKDSRDNSESVTNEGTTARQSE